MDAVPVIRPRGLNVSVGDDPERVGVPQRRQVEPRLFFRDHDADGGKGCERNVEGRIVRSRLLVQRFGELDASKLFSVSVGVAQLTRGEHHLGARRELEAGPGRVGLRPMLGARVDFGIRPRARPGVGEGGKRFQDGEIEVRRRAEVSIETPLAVYRENTRTPCRCCRQGAGAPGARRPRDRVSP